MRQFVVMFGAAIVLMACTPPVPDSARGVGFEDYDTYLARQQAQQNASAPQSVQTTTANTPATQAEQTAAAAVEAVRPETPTTTANSARAAQPDNPNISDEQDFEAVSSRRTIEDDAARVQEKRTQYTVIQPTAIPNRPSGTAQTPIQFALATSHPVGQKVYRRGLGGARKAETACAQYENAEKAQDEFLKNGGPEKDKLGLDPDGDGYACGWNPATYQGLLRG